MLLEEYSPGKHLAPFIQSYRIIESANEITNTVLPGTSMTMAFRFKGQTAYLNPNHSSTLPFGIIAGLQKTARNIHYERDTATIVVLFKETGLAAFLKQPLHELYTQSIALDYFFPRTEIEVVQERLTFSKSNRERIAVVESFLTSKLAGNHHDALIGESIARIHYANGNIRINELLGSLYLSKDAFEKRFRKLIGATPKQFAQIVKMNSVIRKNRINPSYPDLAFENGFYDQPHFNRDFKLFTGKTPKEFFGSTRYW